MNFNENDLLREKTELLYLRISKLTRAKVLLKLECDTEDQVLLLFQTAQIVKNIVYAELGHVSISVASPNDGNKITTAFRFYN